MSFFVWGRFDTERTLGCLLVAWGAALPLGEGAVWAVSGLVGLWLARHARTLDKSILWTGAPGRAVQALGAYLAFGLFAVWAGGHGFLQPKEWGRLGPWALLPAALLALGATSKDWHARAVWGFVVSLCLAAAYGLMCYGLDWRPGLTRLGRSDLAAHQSFVPGLQRVVAGGFYLHRLKMAHVLLLGIGALGARQLALNLRPARRAVEAAALALLLVCLLLTFARGAFMGVAGGAALALCIAPRRRQMRACLAAVSVAAVLMGLPQVRARLRSTGNAEAAAVRGLIWSQAIEVVCDHPLGVGLGNYTPLIGRYYDRIDPGFATRTYPHNILLGAWAEAGPGGLVAYATVWLTLSQLAFKAGRRRGWPQKVSPAAARGAAAAAMAALFVTGALWTVGMTHDVLYHNVVGQAYVLALAWCLVACSRAPGGVRAG